MIIAIDQSFKACGICIDGEPDVFYPTGKDTIEKMKSILEFVDSKKRKVMVLEGLSFGSVSTSVRMLGYLLMRLEEYCRDNDCEFHEISPMSLKKCAGKGGLKKYQMFNNLDKKLQLKIFEKATEGQTEKKKQNMLERFKDLEKNAKYFESSTSLLDICDAVWLYRYYKKDCANA